MPGGLDFGKGLLDVNFQMWPLFTCLSLDNILTICEIALSPTGRILFVSKHPAMLGVAVSTIKYLVELRGWSGITLPSVHTRDAKIYLEDPGPWIVGLAAEARYVVRVAPEVCLVDLDINYVSCASPPTGAISLKAQREKYRRRLASAFDSYFHPDYSIPSEFKEAFPAGRFRSVAKIQSRRGASSSVSVEGITPPEWWHWTKVVQAFSDVLQARDKKPSLLKRVANLRQPKKQAKLTPAELLVQLALRKRASAFVDARDDLETKIGRLTRRLNFLLTESDLWREKFVTFEQYAEKLSGEATDLRAKIGKEQRESKRLTSLVTMTAQEKAKLASQLADTEGAHRAAVDELERMKGMMEKMEEERALMVAEVEAQIERALESMMIGAESDGAEDEDGEWDGDEDQLEEIPNSPPASASALSGKARSRAPSATRTGNGRSRPQSPRSVTSNESRSRPSTRQAHTIRSFGTASTLAEIVDRVESVQKQLKARKGDGYHSSSGADEEEDGGSKVRPTSPKAASTKSGRTASTKSGRTASTKSGKHGQGHARRFSAAAPIEESDGSPHEGSMQAIDAGITERADKIAEKVHQIQQKVRIRLLF
jgi:nicotinamide N-methyltransferase